VTVVIRDWQFDLSGVGFGVGKSIAVSKFDRGAFDIRDQDQAAARGDVRRFGTDRHTPGVWVFEMFTNLRDATAALDAVEQLEVAWDAEDIRLTPDAAVPLRYRINGRDRRVYGRPRRFSYTPQALTTAGRIDIVADFALADRGSYDDEEQSVPLSVGATTLTGAGVVFPVRFPVVWGGQGGDPGTRTIFVGGRRRTGLTATMTGPLTGSITNPYVIVDGATFQLRGLLGAGETVIVSALPWAQGVYRPDGTTAPLALAAEARLDNLLVTPGPHVVTFGGADNTGTAGCVVTWRDSYLGH
jgi:hypothetical protein